MQHYSLGSSSLVIDLSLHVTIPNEINIGGLEQVLNTIHYKKREFFRLLVPEHTLTTLWNELFGFPLMVFGTPILIDYLQCLVRPHTCYVSMCVYVERVRRRKGQPGGRKQLICQIWQY